MSAATGEASNCGRTAPSAQRQLAELVAEIRSSIDVLLAADPDTTEANRLTGGREALVEAEAHWQQYRDATCRYAYFQLYPGSMARLEEFACREALTRQRIAQLERMRKDAGQGIDY